MGRETISEQLERARMLFAVLEGRPDLRERLARLSYAPEELAAGRALYLAAAQARTVHHASRATQLQASGALRGLRQQVDSQYRDLAAMGRVVFRDDTAALVGLGLRRAERRSARAVFFARVGQLYEGVADKPEWLAALSAVGYDAERLAAERGQFAALKEARTVYESARGDARNAADAQQAALRALGNWLRRLFAIAAIALRDAPDDLRALGVQPRR